MSFPVYLKANQYPVSPKASQLPAKYMRDPRDHSSSITWIPKVDDVMAQSHTRKPSRLFFCVHVGTCGVQVITPVLPTLRLQSLQDATLAPVMLLPPSRKKVQ